MVPVGEVHVGDGGPHVPAPVAHFALLERSSPALREAHLGAEVSVAARRRELEGAATPPPAARAHAPAPRAQHHARAAAASRAAAVWKGGEER